MLDEKKNPLDKEISLSIYQLRIRLLRTNPNIWRSLLVSNYTTLEEFHIIIQKIFSWSNYFSHTYSINKIKYGSLENRLEFDDRVLNEKNYYLKDLPVNKIKYFYGFEDEWEHQIIFEKKLEYKKEFTYPICIGGENAAPPECFFPSDYDLFLKEFYEIKSPKKQMEFLNQVQKNFHPTKFLVNEINKLLMKDCVNQHIFDGKTLSFFQLKRGN